MQLNYEIFELQKRSADELFERIVNYYNYWKNNGCVNLDVELFHHKNICLAFLNKNLSNVRERREKLIFVKSLLKDMGVL